MNMTPGSCTAEMPYGYQPCMRGLYIATELVIAVLAIIGNFLVCLAVSRNKTLCTVTNYFLVSLSVADILVGLVAISCAVLTDLVQPHHDLPLCLLLLSILMVLTQDRGIRTKLTLFAEEGWLQEIDVTQQMAPALSAATHTDSRERRRR